MIIITKVFQKELKWYDTSLLDEIISLIGKYHRGLDKNIFVLQEHENFIVLKGYLAGKNIRILIARYPDPYYVPLLLLRKESKLGWNIREDFDIEIPMKKAEICFQNKQFETFKIK
jgi:hypothetical protein